MFKLGISDTDEDLKMFVLMMNYNAMKTEMVDDFLIKYINSRPDVGFGIQYKDDLVMLAWVEYGDVTLWYFDWPISWTLDKVTNRKMRCSSISDSELIQCFNSFIVNNRT